MDHLDVDAFISVADLGSFKDAARSLFVSETTVSRRVRALEDELGVERIVRSRKGATLSPAGQTLIEPARAMVGAAIFFKQEAKSIEDSQRTELRVGYIGWSYEELVLVNAIEETRKRFPDLRVPLHMDKTEALVDMLSDGQLDAALLFGGSLSAASPLLRRQVGSSPAVAILPRDHLKARKKTLGFADLSGEVLLSEGSPVYGLQSEYFRDRLESLGSIGLVVKSVGSYKSIPALVAVGQGIGIANAWMANPFPRHVVYRTIEDDRYEIVVEFVWRPECNQVIAESFAAALEKAFGTLFD